MVQAATNTPEQGTGSTIHGAAGVIESLLADSEDVDTQQAPSSEEKADEAAVEDNQSVEEPEQGSIEDVESADVEDQPSEEEEQAEPEDGEVQYFDVNGEQLSFDDLKSGYLRQQDYTRKTQDLSDQRKQFTEAAEDQATRIREERERLQQERQQVQQYMQEFMPQEPDWNKLYQDDPAEYAAQRENWRSWQDRKKELDEQQGKEQAQQQQQHQQQMQQLLQEEYGKLAEAIPEWQDQNTAQSEKQRLLNWSQRVGYSQDEMNSVVDHRALVVARKAMLYDELMDKQAKTKPKAKKQGSPKPAKPGAKSQVNPQRKAVETARDRSRKSGNVKDAAQLIELMLPDEE